MMIGVFGKMLLNSGLPSIAKYPLLIISVYVGSNLIVSLFLGTGRFLRERAAVNRSKKQRVGKCKRRDTKC
jgi:hypothetical protein